MTSSRERFIQLLDDASDRIEDVPRHELRALIRRAALRLRNADAILVDPAVDCVLCEIAVELREPKPDLVRRILREWLEQNAYLPVRPEIDEDSETDGAA